VKNPDWHALAGISHKLEVKSTLEEAQGALPHPLNSNFKKQKK